MKIAFDFDGVLLNPYIPFKNQFGIEIDSDNFINYSKEMFSLIKKLLGKEEYDKLPPVNGVLDVISTLNLYKHEIYIITSSKAELSKIESWLNYYKLLSYIKEIIQVKSIEEKLEKWENIRAKIIVEDDARIALQVLAKLEENKSIPYKLLILKWPGNEWLKESLEENKNIIMIDELEKILNHLNLSSM